MFGRRPRKGLSLRSFDKFYRAPLLGIDEVGTGAIAGPIFAAGVVLPREKSPAVLDALEKLGLRDSKQMGVAARDQVFKILTTEKSVRYWVACRFPEDIIGIGHYECIAACFEDIITGYATECEEPLGTILIDGDPNRKITYTVDWLQKADDKSLTVAAASVLAKVSRDRFMIELDQKFPEWDFGNHKGYLTRSHQAALEKHGVCAAHRQNTQPVKEAMARRTSLPEVSQTAVRSES